MHAAPAGVVLSLAALLPVCTHAAPLDLAVVSCGKYENEIVASTGTGPAPVADPIDTVMWLFGFSVAKSGERSMFGDSLPAFGYALDGECKSNPTKSLLDAVVAVKSKRDNPMDLTGLSCSVFEARHVALRKSDPESATTLTMWLFGYAVGLTDGHVLDAGSLGHFDGGLDEHCALYPNDSLFDALSAANSSATAPKRGSTPRR